MTLLQPASVSAPAGGAGLGAERIYCHDAGDRLQGSVPSAACSQQQHHRTRPITSASKRRGGKSPKISRSRDIVDIRGGCLVFFFFVFVII